MDLDVLEPKKDLPKKKNKLTEALLKEKPLFDPSKLKSE